MPRKDTSNDALEQAMADALESVEKIERGGVDDDADEAMEEIEVEAAAEPPEAEDSNDQEALRDQLLRLAADFDNFRKRSRKEQEEALVRGAERIIKDLLPVLDNMDRALAHAGDDSHPVIDGVRMVHKQLIDSLGSHGVKGFESSGEVFDPQRHEAVSQGPCEDQDAGTILEELEKGYTLGDRLLRPAKVIVVAPKG